MTSPLDDASQTDEPQAVEETPKVDKFTITLGKRKSQATWTQIETLTLAEFYRRFMVALVGTKDGECFTPAIFSGKSRNMTDAMQIGIATLDSDCGHDIEEIKAAVQARNWAAIIHSTFSHLTDQTLIAAEPFDKWAAIEGNNREDVAAFMFKAKGYLPRVVEGATIIDETTVGKTRSYLVQHKPCPKFRIILLLSSPWFAEDYDGQGQARTVWRERYLAAGHALKLRVDEACTDPSRLFYLPRIAEAGREYLHAFIEGGPCNIWELPAAPSEEKEPEERKGGRKKKGGLPDGHIQGADANGELIDLTTWARKYAPRFEIYKALRARAPGIFGQRKSGGKYHLLCPFDGDHITGGLDMTGTFVVDASHSGKVGMPERAGSFFVHCSHNGCVGRDRLGFVGKFLSDGSLSVPDLTDAAFLVPEEEVEIGIMGTASGAMGVIRCSPGQQHHMTSQAETAIMAAGLPIYQRGPFLMMPTFQETPAGRGRVSRSPVIKRMTAPSLLDAFSQSARWMRYAGENLGWVQTDPPRPIAEMLLSRSGQWMVPKISGVITTPTLRPDGSILWDAGFDEATGLFHFADASIDLSELEADPTKEDAEKALKLLDDLLEEFPFVSPLDRAVALSLIITAVVRGSLSVAPLHAIKAFTPGTGKSYLIDLISAIAAGRPCPAFSQSSKEDEAEKRLVGALLSGTPLISIDNCNGDLKGETLCQAIERPIVSLRALGKSDMFDIESRATIIANGNNLRVCGDLVRRTVVCNLDAALERPELREFRMDPVNLIMANRGRYIAAAMTVVLAYRKAGLPGKAKRLASFEDWSDTIRSALIWLGKEDPCKSMDAARDDDPELGQMRDMIELWHGVFGNLPCTLKWIEETSAERHINPTTGFPGEMKYPELREALLDVASDMRGGVATKRLSSWMRRHMGRVVNGKRFVTAGNAQGGIARWRVELAVKAEPK